MGIIIKTQEEIDMLRQAGHINHLALEAVVAAVRPGITTRALDRIAAEVIRDHGAEPAFLDYPNRTYPDHPYPAVINASINDELVHGVPSRRRLKEGDILSIDVGTVYQGWVGDSATTVAVGQISSQAQELLDVTREALRLAIAVCRLGQRFGDISAAIQGYVEGRGYQVVREYTGHGVGRAMHEDPQIYNWGKANRGAPLKAGMVFALEPMVTIGPPDLYVKKDYWTVATEDRRLCAHFEHTLAVTEGEPDILTL